MAQSRVADALEQLHQQRQHNWTEHAGDAVAGRDREEHPEGDEREQRWNAQRPGGEHQAERGRGADQLAGQADYGLGADDQNT